MNLDLEICAYAIRTGDMRGLLAGGVTVEILDGKGREVYEKLKAFYDKYGSLPTANAFQDQTGLDLRELQGMGQERLEFYLDELHNRVLLNTIREGSRGVGESLQNKNSQEALENLRKLTKDAGEVSRGRSPLVTMDDLVDERIATYERAELAQGGITGHRFPWPIINESTGGLQPTDYFLIVGKRGLGKSWVLCNLINCFAEQDLKVLVVSMEMPNITLQRRLTCVRGKFRPSDLKLGRLNQAKDHYVEFERTSWSGSKILFSPDGRVKTLGDLDSVIEEAGEDLDVVLIDGMYLLDQGQRREEVWQRVARVSFHCRQAALSRGILLGGTVQFNRQLKVQKLNADLDKIAHADAMTFDATHVWAIVQDATLESMNRMRILNLKNREGSEDHVDIMWDIDSMDFEEIGRPKDLEGDYHVDGEDQCQTDTVAY